MVSLNFQIAHAVVNGQPTSFGSSDIEKIARNFTVRLVRLENNKAIGFCSGGAFAPSEVLSAAHCFEDEKVKEALSRGLIFVEFYDKNSENKVRRVQVRSVDKKKNEGTDMALLRLASESPTRMSLPLAYSGCDDDSGYISAGFGITENGENASAVEFAHYRKMNSKEIDDLVKVNLLKHETGSDNNWIVLRSVKGSSCVGDSGGPIFCRAKGRWALAAVNTLVAAGKMSLMPKTYKAEEYCKSADLLQVNRIEPKMQLIESWRHPPRSNADTSKVTR